MSDYRDLNTGARVDGHTNGTDEDGNVIYVAVDGYEPAFPYWSNEDGNWVRVKPSLVERVEMEATKDAALFVEEFNEPLDSSETDWDSEAWSGVSLNLTDDEQDVLWPIYQAKLVAETERLCEVEA